MTDLKHLKQRIPTGRPLITKQQKHLLRKRRKSKNKSRRIKLMQRPMLKQRQRQPVRKLKKRR